MPLFKKYSEVHFGSCQVFMMELFARIRSFFFGPYFPAFGLRIPPHSVRLREKADQKNSKYGHFPRSEQ